MPKGDQPPLPPSRYQREAWPGGIHAGSGAPTGLVRSGRREPSLPRWARRPKGAATPRQYPPPKTGASAGCSRRCWSRPRWSWSRPLPWLSFWAPITMSSPRFTPPAPPCRPVTRPPPSRGQAIRSGPGRRRARSRASVPGMATTGPAPLLSSLSPSTGGSGQQVTVSGTDFLSADGEIVAHFGGQSAATSCPSQTLCLVTVPLLPGSPRSVPVSITTDAGTSATLDFHYL